MDYEQIVPTEIKDLLVISAGEGDEEQFNTLTELVIDVYSYNETRAEMDDLFTKMVVSAFTEGSVEMIPTILDFYKEMHPGILPSPYTYLFMLPYERFLNSSSVIMLLKGIFQDLLRRFSDDEDARKVNWLVILEQLVKLNHPETTIFIERLFDVFPKRLWTREILKGVVELAHEVSSHAFEILFKIYVEVSPYAPVPKWVRNFVFDPHAYPLDIEWFYKCKEKSKYEPDVVKEAEEKKVPYWMINEDFEFEDQDDQSIYRMVKNQDTPLGFFIQEDNEAFDDVKKNQLPFWEDMSIPDYPETKYTTESILRNLPNYWDDTWGDIERNIAQSGQDIKLETDPEEELKFLRSRVLSLNLYDLELLFSNYLGKLEDDEKTEDTYYFRIFGPRNAIPTGESEEGGERMLTSEVFDYDEDEDEVSNWFLGHCLICARRIRRKQHALRIPVIEGGWRGCYCTPECALKDISEYDEVTPRLLEEVVDDLYAVGIQDFISEELAEEEE